MNYYTKQFLKSEQFYDRFYLPNISLEHYVIWENRLKKLGTHAEATRIVNNEYILHCKRFFKENIYFYNELSEYILDINGNFKQLDDYVFFKLRYYGTKFLDMLNENRNFFEEELKKFASCNYGEGLLRLSKANLHDAEAIFTYKSKILQIHYRPGAFEKIFEFRGVEEWEERNFLKMRPTLIIDEVYEKSGGYFAYNTLWNHQSIDGENYSELSIKFTDVTQIK